MSALVPTRGLADSLAELFAEVDAEPIAALLAEYATQRATVERIAGIFGDPSALAVLPYFVDGNEASTHGSVLTSRLFALDGALKALDAKFWGRALEATDVLQCMPASKRSEWHKQIEKRDVPPFTEAALRSTLADHLAARPQYFAERVDGLFRSLSPDHKTNLPQGFRSKMIITGIGDEYSYSTIHRDALIDLRVVVARFMGRDDIGEGSWHVRDNTMQIVKYARNARRGEWVSLDGNAIEIRCYANGNCHVRVHDELAWRLNAVLAYLHPTAIPADARTRPKKRAKQPTEVELVLRPLPFPVVRALGDMVTHNLHHRVEGWPMKWAKSFNWYHVDKHVEREVDRVIESVGGVKTESGWSFDYDATTTLREIVATGVVPDQRAHQYYPTPRALAERVVALAEIGPADRVLEPSAGQGAIADLVPRGSTPNEGAQVVCIEASSLHCTVLRAKHYHVVHGDFLDASLVADAHGNRIGDYHFDRVVMNPPFDRGQWQAHVERAAKLLPGRGARLVAVLPAGAPSKLLVLPGFALTWSEPIHGAFAGTNMSVVILTAVRA